MIEILALIETRRDAPKPFSAGIVLWDDRVVEAAPIVRYMKRWDRDRVRKYCAERGWSVAIVHRLERAQPDRGG